MHSFLLATDSTADLPEEFLKEEGITVFNLTYTIAGTSYGHGEELPFDEFYNLMREGELPKTSQVNPDEARENLEALLKINKNILYLAFSSGLSGTYNSIRLAAEELMEEDESNNIVVIDTLSASLGEGLMVYKAAKLREEGLTLEDTAKWIEENKLHFVHMFTVDDLNHLFRGGRVSKTAAVIGTVLNIKPVLHVDNEGHLVPINKLRGRKKALMSLVDEMENRMGSFRDKNDVVFISHGDCLEDALRVKEEIACRFGITKCIINHIGPTIGAHSGPGTVALFFLGDMR